MKYIRTKEGKIIDTTRRKYITNGNDLILHKQYETVGGPEVDVESPYVPSVAIIEKHNEYIFVGVIDKQADTIEELIQVGDIVFYYDFHSQTEQCLYIRDCDLMFAKEMNTTRLLIPVGKDYKQVAKATHEYHQFDCIKQVTKKGKLELL